MNPKIETPEFPITLAASKMKLAVITALSILLLVLPQQADAQFEAVEASLNSAAIGGTKGYRLRRIGAANASGSVNSNFIYYPASSIKVLQHFYAMTRVEDGSWNLNTTLVSTCNGADNENCDGTMNVSAGCGAINEPLGTSLELMMENSSNQRTNAIQEKVGSSFFPPGAPFHDDYAFYGRLEMTNFAQGTLGMSNTGLYSKFGCDGACGATPNTMTQVDIEKLYRNIANNNSLLSYGNRVELYNRMLNSTSSFLNTIIDQEAAALNKQAHAAAFKAETYIMWKGGSWTCSGGKYVSNSGLVQFPTWNGAFKRLFTYSVFIDDGDDATYLGQSFSDARNELLRYAVRGALMTWSLPFHGQVAADDFASATDPGTSGIGTPAGSLLLDAHNAYEDAARELGKKQPNFASAMVDLQIASTRLEQLNGMQQGATNLYCPPCDSVLPLTSELGIELVKDVMALVVSTGDDSTMTSKLGLMSRELTIAKNALRRKDHSTVMAACVAAAAIGNPMIVWTGIDSVYLNTNIGFAPAPPSLTLQRPKRQMSQQSLSNQVELKAAPILSADK